MESNFPSQSSLKISFSFRSLRVIRAGCLRAQNLLGSGLQMRVAMSFLRELSIAEIVSRLAAALLYAGTQGQLLAGLARLMGDRKPQYDGRLTPSPFAHVAAWGMLMAALFAMSWIRPMRFDPQANRFGRWGIVFIVVFGLAGTLVLVPALDLLRPLALYLPRTGSYAVLIVLEALQKIIVGSTLLNLLPVPGLIAGSMLWAAWPAHDRRLRRWEPIALALVGASIIAGLLPNLSANVLPYLKLV
jgi:hypothetical protein